MGIGMEYERGGSVLDGVLGEGLEDTACGIKATFLDNFPGVPSPDVLDKRVIEYGVRLLDDDKADSYSMNDVGYFKITSGKDVDGRSSVLPGLYHGRFIDVIRYAVCQPEFFAVNNKGNLIDDARNVNNGLISKVSFEVEDVVEVSDKVW